MRGRMFLLPGRGVTEQDKTMAIMASGIIRQWNETKGFLVAG